jgi:cytoskeletal protein CcmA (bactofilin family)
MWGNKKPEALRKAATPEESRAVPVAPRFAPPVEARPMTINDPVHTPAATERTARLGASLQVKGEITGNEDLHVDGTVEGLIHLEDRKLVVGASGKVSADVIAREVVVNGSVKGNLRAKDRIEIKKDGSVVGDLTTARIMIEDGAYFKGSIEIDRGAEAEASADPEKPAYLRAPSRASSRLSD